MSIISILFLLLFIFVLLLHLFSSHGKQMIQEMHEVDEIVKRHEKEIFYKGKK